MFARRCYVLGFALALTMCMGLSGAIANEECNLFGCDDDCEFTRDFRLQDCWWFNTVGINPYFKLIPGLRLYLNNQNCVDDEECEELEEVWVTVLWETEWIDLRDEGLGWVKTRVVEEREKVDGTLIEVSRNFFAICKKTNSVYYFGEDVYVCESGLVPVGDGFVCEDDEEEVSREGEWRAGEGDPPAMPGLIMPGTFLLGSKYFQEVAATAADRAENTAMGLNFEDPKGDGDFIGCVEVTDTNPLDDPPVCEDGDVKIYCPGVGLVQDEELELVDYGFVHQSRRR